MSEGELSRWLEQNACSRFTLRRGFVAQIDLAN